MKKSIFLSTLFCALLITSISAQNIHNYSVMKSDFNEVKLHFSTSEIQVNDIRTDVGTFSRLTMDGYYSTTQVGNPELPTMIKMIEIPLCGNVQARVVSSTSRTVSGNELGIEYPVYPAQPSRSKSDDGPFTLVKNETTYTTNAFYSRPLVSVEKTGIMRSVNMATVSVCPVTYNPVTNEFTIYDDITVEITFDNADIAATQRMKTLHSNSFFNTNSQIINPIQSNERDVLSTTPIKYVIVANSIFNGQLDAFANWKRRKGFLVEIAYTSTIGTTTTAIKSYLQGLYDNATAQNPAPTYVLLVGDQAQIPTYTGQSENSHITDLYYFTWTTGDNIPDCYFGRFSAQNVSQLTPQIEKTLMYEQYTMNDPTYLDKAVLVAGEDGGQAGDFGYTHANPVMHYLENTYVTSSYGYTAINSFYNPHSSGNAATIRNLLGAGVGFANYSAHCGSNGWSIPSFSTSDISSMSNSGKYGLMIGNCCQSNKFEESECFGEALLRTANKGAVGYIGGTDYTYWDEDYYWAAGIRNISSLNQTPPTYDANNLGVYDKMFHTHNEAYSKWFTTQGAIIMAGNIAVEASSTSLKKYYWEIYELMGDPSVMTWLTQPSNMTIRVDNNAVVNSTYETIDGTTTFTVSTGAPYSYIALTENLTLITAVLSDANGNATLTFPALAAGTTYELAASAQNYKTTFTTINVIAASGANVAITDALLSNGSINNAGENIQLDVSVANRGVDPATNVVVSAATTSPYITLTDATETVGTMAGSSNRTLATSFAAAIDNSTPDGTIATIEFTVNYLDAGVAEMSTYEFPLTINAASLNYVSNNITITSGNGDGVIDPGETVTLSIVDANEGNADLANVTSELSTYYYLAPVTNSPIAIGTVQAQNNCTSAFNITISNNVPVGTIIPYYHHIYSTSNPTISRMDTFYLSVGAAIETWEDGTFTANEWDNTSSYPWTIVSDNVYEGTHSAKSGNVGVNNSTSELQITFETVNGGDVSYARKVSSESSYDFFRFYIDNVQQEEISGEVDWQVVSFPVTAGTHTIKFTFYKDAYVATGSDCAWIDNITFPFNGEIAPILEGLTIISAGLSAGSQSDEGASVTFDATLMNFGNDNVSNIANTLTTTSPYITLTDNTEALANLAGGATSTLSAAFAGTIANQVPDGTIADFTLTSIYLLNGDTDTTTYPFSLTLNAPNLQFVSSAFAEQIGNSDGFFDAGETVTLDITDANLGHVALQNMVSELSTYYNLVTINNPVTNIGTMASETDYISNYTIAIAPTVPDGSIIPFFHHVFSTTNPTYELYDTVYLFIGKAVEDWESGGFNEYAWVNSTTYPWTMTQSGVYEGSYAAISPTNLGYNSSSSLELEINAAEDGVISYYRYLSYRRSGYNFSFSIDGVEQERISITATTPWTRAEFLVTAGTHTISFTFARTGYQSHTSNYAMVDFISFPVNGTIVYPPDTYVVATHDQLSNGFTGNYGENLEWDITLENRGIADAHDVNMTLTTNSPYITINNNTEVVGDMAASASQVFTNAFNATIANNTPDQTAANFTITVGFEDTLSTTYHFSNIINAPAFAHNSYNLTETVGNGSGDINPGETAQLQIRNRNAGHADAQNVTSVLTTDYALANITTATQNFATMNLTNNYNSNFVIEFDAAIPDGTIVPFYHHLYNAGYERFDTIYVTVQKSHVIITDVALSQGVNADFNSSITLDVTLENIGSTATGITLTLSTTTSELTLTDNAETIGNLAGGATQTYTAVFAGDIQYLIEDQMLATLLATVNYDGESNDTTVELPLNAPRFNRTSYNFSEIVGNQDGDVNPGETINLQIIDRNIGHANIANVTSSLTTDPQYATIVNPSQNFTSMNVQTDVYSNFDVVIDANTPFNTIIPFYHHIYSGSYEYFDTIYISVVEMVVMNADLVRMELTPGYVAEYDQTVTWDAMIANRGNREVNNARINISTTSPFVTLLDNQRSLSNIPVGDSISLTDIFTTHISASVPDQTIANFTVVLSYNGNFRDTTIISLTINAPHFALLNGTITETVGNNDNIITPGETFTMVITDVNNGHAALTPVNSLLSADFQYLTINDMVQTIATVEAGDTIVSEFSIYVSPEMPENTTIPFTHHLYNDIYTSYDFESVVYVNIGSTGIAENGTAVNRIFPNPTTDHITVELAPMNQISGEIAIYDIYGKLLFTTPIVETVQTIDMSTFAPGMYLIKIMDGNQTIQTEKIIKK
ncbi:MAG TPA: C25 family cysteine peptidase [Bacteroidales bacterium]|nr:C25 family cysteine peptidase [Bacteroidales bacterium]